MNNGFLYVATCDYKYYEATKNSIDSLKDEYPEAKVAVYTHESWVDNELREMLNDDDFIITENVPCHVRAKLWALPKTPFDITLYIDCDTYIHSEEIKDVFDLLGDNDMMFHKITPKVAAVTKFAGGEGELEIHGGVFLYNRNAIKFMQDWWDLYKNTRTKDSFMDTFGLSSETYKDMKFWDQTPLWYLINKTEHGLKWDWFKDNTKYNYIEMMNYRDELKRKDYCIYHYTISKQFNNHPKDIECTSKISNS